MINLNTCQIVVIFLIFPKWNLSVKWEESDETLRSAITMNRNKIHKSQDTDTIIDCAEHQDSDGNTFYECDPAKIKAAAGVVVKNLQHVNKVLEISPALAENHRNLSVKYEESDKIILSAITMNRNKIRESHDPGTASCAEHRDTNGNSYFECDPAKIQAVAGLVVQNLQILNKVLEISPVIAEKYRIVLICNATCPAIWRFFPAKEELKDIFTAVEVLASRQVEFDSTDRIIKFRHYVKLMIQSSSREMTGRYVCECVQSPGINDYIYMYLEEQNKPILVNANDGKLLYTYPSSESESWSYLPCGLSKPGQSLHLFVNNAHEDTYIQVFPNASILENPFSGFKINPNELASVYDCVWMCSTTMNMTQIQNGQDAVHTLLFSTKKRFPITNNSLRPYSFTSHGGRSDFGVACCRKPCSGSGCATEAVEPPMAAAYPVRNALTAALLKPLLNHTSIRWLEGVPLRCLVELARANEENESMDSLGYMLNCNPTYVRQHMVDVAPQCSTFSVPLDIKSGFIFQCDGNEANSSIFSRDPQLMSTAEYFPALNGRRSLIRHSNVTGDVRNTTMRLTMVMEELDTGMVSTLAEVKQWKYFQNGTVFFYKESYGTPSDSIFDERILAQAAQTRATEGEQRCYICEVTEYHFVAGLLWAVNWANGSQTISKNSGREIMTDLSTYYPENTNMPPRLTSKYCPTMRLGMESISCYAPIWNSKDWKALSITTPQILKSEKPSVELEIQKNFDVFIQIPKKLTCKFNSKSALLVEWLINDRVVQEMLEPNPSCILSECKQLENSYLFEPSDYNMEPYVNVTCNGSHFMGYATQTFQLHIIDKTIPRILGPEFEKHEFQYGDVDQAFNCSAKGYPQPGRIHWYKDGDNETVIQEDEFEIDKDLSGTSTSILKIPEVSMTTAGTYVCVAGNHIGEVVKKKFYATVFKPLTTQFIIAGSLLLVIVLSGIFVCLLIKFKKENRELMKLERIFRTGILPESTSADGDLRQRHLALPYTGNHEIDEALWQKQSRLDAGQFGEVWKGELRSLGNFSRPKSIAIKCLSEAGRNVEKLKVLCSELKMMMFVNQLGSHPNVVNFLGATTKHFQRMEVYILMELCTNGSVKKYIENNTNKLFRVQVGEQVEIASPQISIWAVQIARGMTFLSENKILHIDLAARNVFLSENLVAKVGDFGLSRNLYGSCVYKRKEVDLPQLWAAPEALRDNIITVKSDIWSYGVTAWELFSKGLHPSYGANIDVIEEIDKGHRLPKPPSATDETYKLLLDCWNEDPSLRPSFDTLISYFDLLSQTPTMDAESVTSSPAPVETATKLQENSHIAKTADLEFELNNLNQTCLSKVSNMPIAGARNYCSPSFQFQTAIPATGLNKPYVKPNQDLATDSATPTTPEEPPDILSGINTNEFQIPNPYVLHKVSSGISPETKPGGKAEAKPYTRLEVNPDVEIDVKLDDHHVAKPYVTAGPFQNSDIKPEIKGKNSLPLTPYVTLETKLEI